jgi:hypothetical protein
MAATMPPDSGKLSRRQQGWMPEYATSTSCERDSTAKKRQNQRQVPVMSEHALDFKTPICTDETCSSL